MCIAALAILMGGCNNSGQAGNEANGKDFLQMASERYSVRKFTGKQVSQEDIDKILEAARVAPTAMNRQPFKIYVFKSKESIELANKLSPCIYGAPQAFLICIDHNLAGKRGNGTYGEIDCSIVLTQMMLEAWDLGIGTCMVGMFNMNETVKALNLPETIEPLLFMPFGYAAEDAVPGAGHTQSRPLGDMVEYL